VRIALLVYNTFRNDARVEKAALAYAEAGHDVRVLALPDPQRPVPADRVLRVDPRPSLVLRAQPEPGTHGGSFSWRVLSDRGRLYGYLWSVERVLLGWLRMGGALVTAVALWWRAKERSRQGRLRSLLYFADRIRGYRAFARHAFAALERAGFRPELVHANDFNTLFTAELLHERWGVPFIYDAHELWAERNRGASAVHPLERAWELDAERRIARKALRVVTVSPSIGRHLASTLSVADPVLVRNVPHARRGATGPRGLRSALGLPADAKLVVYTGKATYNRGIEDIAAAFARLPASFHFVVLGNYEAVFKAAVLDPLVERHRLQGRFHQHGPVPSDEVPHWAAEGDLCVVPIKGAACLSYEYCLPNKLFEGIQAGLPVIATNLVDMKRTLDEHQCGLTYESGNADDLRDKVLYVLSTPEVAQKLRANAAAAARRLNWESEKARLLGLLEAV
jgi:glycosyltransferase involved in cell wall biosynthesis